MKNNKNYILDKFNQCIDEKNTTGFLSLLGMCVYMEDAIDTIVDNLNISEQQLCDYFDGIRVPEEAEVYYILKAVGLSIEFKEKEPTVFELLLS